MESNSNKEVPSTTEIKENFKIKCAINKWEQKTNKTTGKLEVIFNIELFSELTNKKWSVFHSIQDFKDLISNLSPICINLPDFQGFKSLESEKASSSIISKASSAIIEFINNISHRSDILNTKYYIEFLQLENHFNDLKKYEPKEKFKITNLKYEVSDIILLEKLDLLVVSCAKDVEQNVLTKMNFWSKKEKNGQLNIYKVNNNNQYYTLIAQADTDSEISCLFTIEEIKKVLVGYINGVIDVYDLPEYSEIQQNSIKLVVKNTIEIGNKKNRIINIGYNSTSKLFYSACFKDIMIYSGNIGSKKNETFIPGSDNDLCGFSHIEKYNNNVNDLVIIIDIKGKISIGVVNQETKSLSLLFVLLGQISPISLFKVSWEYNHIYIGDKDGNLDILSFDISQTDNIEDKNKVKVTKIFNTCLSINSKNKIANMITRNFPYKINDIWYNPKKKEIFIGLANGTIQILSHFKNFAECIIYQESKPKEEKGINRIYFSKLDSILYAARAQKDIIVYQMPENYYSEVSRKLEDTNSFEILKGSKSFKNAINTGHPQTTLFFKKKTLIEKFGAEEK